MHSDQQIRKRPRLKQWLWSINEICLSTDDQSEVKDLYNIRLKNIPEECLCEATLSLSIWTSSYGGTSYHIIVKYVYSSSLVIHFPWCPQFNLQGIHIYYISKCTSKTCLKCNHIFFLHKRFSSSYVSLWLTANEICHRTSPCHLNAHHMPHRGTHADM